MRLPRMSLRRGFLALGACALLAALSLPRSAGAEDAEKGGSGKEPLLQKAGREVKDTGERAARKLEERGPDLPRQVGKELKKAARKVEKALNE